MATKPKDFLTFYQSLKSLQVFADEQVKFGNQMDDGIPKILHMFKWTGIAGYLTVAVSLTCKYLNEDGLESPVNEVKQ